MNHELTQDNNLNTLPCPVGVCCHTSKDSSIYIKYITAHHDTALKMMILQTVPKNQTAYKNMVHEKSFSSTTDEIIAALLLTTHLIHNNVLSP